jgi:hypothetical protein
VAFSQLSSRDGSSASLREPGQPLRIEHDDHHLFRVFPDATRRLIDDSGLELVDVDDPDADEHVVLVGVPPAEKFRRQIEAG